MNPIKSIAAAAIVAVTSTPALSAVAGNFIGTNFAGTDRNWFNPANWSTGRVPGPADDVVLDGTDDVVIDPALAGRAGGNVEVHSMTLKDDAQLETLPGTHVRHRSFAILDRSQMTTRSGVMEMDDLIVSPPPSCATCGGIGLNPSAWYVSKPAVVIGSSLYFGLGGREPAGITKTGAGTIVFVGYGSYATLHADALALGDGPVTHAITARLTGLRRITATLPPAANAVPRITARIDKLPSQVTARIDRLPRLQLGLHYGFEPAAGGTFQIITTNALLGEFEGLPEGALVGCTEGNVGLSITYRGGDGNDVVLTAADTDPATCATREHILLARQVGVPG
jgi:hypothetical protein